MTNPTPPPEPTLADLKKRYEVAGEELAAATARAFPVDRLVLYTKGKHQQKGRIISSGGHWWHEPDRICVMNVNTGGKSRFSIFCETAKPVLLDP